MFVLYALLVAIPLGLLLGGRIERLGETHVRWAPLAIAGLAIQLVLFADPVAAVVGDAGPPVYVTSTALVLAVVLANLSLPGVPVIALGAASNLVAILANGGWMPADPAALATAGETIGDGYSNSIVVADPALRPLTDIFATPAWLPLSNVFSVGDVLIAAGLAWAVVAAMRRVVRPGTAPGRPGGTGTNGSSRPGSARG